MPISQKLKILMVEDLQTDAELIKREITRSGIRFTSRIVETKEDYLNALQEFDPDIILSDFSLPTFDGMQAILLQQELANHVPFILVTGSINEETAVEVMKAGADDYVIKEHLTRLGAAIRAAIQKKEIIRLRIEADEKLRVFSRAIEQSPSSIIITDAEGKIQFVNAKFTNFMQYSLDEVKGKTPRILNPGHASKEEFEGMWETIKNRNTWHGEFNNRKKDGTKFWENVIISPLLFHSGNISNFILIMEDITEKKKMIDDLVIAKEKAEENDRLKTAFLHNISHEIRTPMNAIVGFCDLLNDPELKPDEYKHYTEIITQSSHQLLSIITDIVNLSTIEAGQERIMANNLNVNSICSYVYEQFILKVEHKGIEISYNTSLPDNEATIISDETKLTQVLTNLLSNAVKFTNLGSIEFGYLFKNDTLEFYVTDSGIGIPEEKHDEIFKRFYQIDRSENRQYGGSGLGLSISKTYIELLGGKIWLTSEAGKGTTFYFNIPYNRQ
ncbi:MAG: hypothetical protein A2X18_05640 [Bacteroidetes bacterium GWF2_40_14]|nr:MAG: hypothetical protein A2X18_05640 [Bacteroidetes bacterium GWF2_40_14]